MRQNASKMEADDPSLDSYAEAVELMHQLPADDSRNWRRQAEIHPAHCAHGTADFLPWHRHYLNQFEKICGTLLGEPQFALPYWDWTHRGGQIPGAFFRDKRLSVEKWNDNGDGHWPPDWPNVRTRGIRALTQGGRLVDDPQRGGNFTRERMQVIMRSERYSIFRRQIEGGPHNSGHVAVGLTGAPPFGHMLDGLSPLDPLFWLHHCNVDRLWAEWQLSHQTPPFDSDYGGHFVNPKGEPVPSLPAELATSCDDLGYTYDAINALRVLGGGDGQVSGGGLWRSPESPLDEFRILASRDVADSLLVNQPFSISLPATEVAEVLSDLQEVPFSMLPDPSVVRAYGGSPSDAYRELLQPITVRRRVYALVEGAAATALVPPTVNIFLNCPYLSRDTPYTDPHFAGSFSFFGHTRNPHGAAHGHGSQDFLVDITGAAETLGVAASSDFNIQLMPVVSEMQGPAAAATAVSFDRISVVSAV